MQEDPQSNYTFDSERDAPVSELCRDGKNLSKKCIMVRDTPFIHLTPSSLMCPADTAAFNEDVPSYAGA